MDAELVRTATAVELAVSECSSYGGLSVHMESSSDKPSSHRRGWVVVGVVEQWKAAGGAVGACLYSITSSIGNATRDLNWS